TRPAFAPNAAPPGSPGASCGPATPAGRPGAETTRLRPPGPRHASGPPSPIVARSEMTGPSTYLPGRPGREALPGDCEQECGGCSVAGAPGIKQVFRDRPCRFSRRVPLSSTEGREARPSSPPTRPVDPRKRTLLREARPMRIAYLSTDEVNVHLAQ